MYKPLEHFVDFNHTVAHRLTQPEVYRILLKVIEYGSFGSTKTRELRLYSTFFDS